VKIKFSKAQWEGIGKKAGWMKMAIIKDDGIADGGTPYTDEEMDLMEKQKQASIEIKIIKDEIAKIVDEFNANLLSKDGFETRMKELIGKMYRAKGTQVNIK